MATPTTKGALLSTPSHRTEHSRLVTRETSDLPRGIIGFKYPNATPVVTSTATEIFRMTNVPCVSNRLYVFGFFIRAIQNLSASDAYFFWQNSNAPSAEPGTVNLVVNTHTFMPASAAYGHMSWRQPFRATTTANITIIIWVSSPANNGQLWLGDQFGNGGCYVQDVGPNRGLQTGSP